MCARRNFRKNFRYKRTIHINRRSPSERNRRKTIATLATHVSNLERICWTCGLCFDTAEELVEHRQLPEFRYVHDRKYVGEFLDSFNIYKCHWCRMGFPSAAGRNNHEMTDLIHWENTVLGYRCEGITDIQCRRCNVFASTSRWDDHVRFGWGHNYCYVCRLDFPDIGALGNHTERFSCDGRHEWVCRKKDCRAVCCSEADLENHCYAWAEYRGNWDDEHASFQCEHCKKILGTLPLWQEHVKTTHQDVLKEYELSNDGYTGEDSWQWYNTITQGLAGCEIV